MVIYLIGNLLVVPGGLLELGDGGVESVRLALEALHLLPDGVHTGGCGGLGGLGSKGDSLKRSQNIQQCRSLLLY